MEMPQLITPTEIFPLQYFDSYTTLQFKHF